MVVNLKRIKNIFTIIGIIVAIIAFSRIYTGHTLEFFDKVFNFILFLIVNGLLIATLVLSRKINRRTN